MVNNSTNRLIAVVYEYKHLLNWNKLASNLSLISFNNELWNNSWPCFSITRSLSWSQRQITLAIPDSLKILTACHQRCSGEDRIPVSENKIQDIRLNFVSMSLFKWDKSKQDIAADFVRRLHCTQKTGISYKTHTYKWRSGVWHDTTWWYHTSWREKLWR